MPNPPLTAEEFRELAAHYAVLEASTRASPWVIKRQYLRLAKTWHPDRFPAGTEAQAAGEEKMKAIIRAYQQIRDAPLRFYTPPAEPPRRPVPSRELLRRAAERRASAQEPVRISFLSYAVDWNSAVVQVIAFLVLIWIELDIGRGGALRKVAFGLIAVLSFLYGERIWYLLRVLPTGGRR